MNKSRVRTRYDFFSKRKKIWINPGNRSKNPLMASLHLFPHLHHFDSSHSIINRTEIAVHNRRPRNFPNSRQFLSPKASVNGGITNGAAAETAAKPSRKGRKKKQTSTVIETDNTENDTIETDPELNPALVDYDDGIDFPYDDPPLVCCFGAVQKEFVPVVRVHDNPMHPDIYSQWKMLQWDPPEFGRAPGGPPSNVAISHVRLGGRAAFMGKVGEDDFGEELVLMMNQERVQTRAVKFDENSKTACTRFKIKFENGKMKAETVKEPPEDSLLASELNLAVLKEVKVFRL